MSLPHHNKSDAGEADPLAAGGVDGPIINPASAASFAHELANLLDASMRNLHLALSSLRDRYKADAADSDPEPIIRLDTVSQAMRQMTDLLRNWMSQRIGTQQLHHQSYTLGQALDHAIRLNQPSADAIGAVLQVRISEEAAGLPAGPVYPVIDNAIRNSIDSLHGGPGGPGGPGAAGLIEIHGKVAGGSVELRVMDNGPGLDPKLLDEQGRFRFGLTTKSDGHGLGMSLSRNVARALKGRLELRNLAGHGATLEIHYPVAAVTEQDPQAASHGSENSNTDRG